MSKEAKALGQESAYPNQYFNGDELYCDQQGLTKREIFAMAAMKGLITLKGADCMDKDIAAKQCVKMADALLKELANE